MNNENDIMDSLLKEHARTKGVDEKFLKDLEVRLDAEERGNVIPLNQLSNKSSFSRGSLGQILGLGVAACAAFYVAGMFIWKDETSKQVIALDGAAAEEQIAKAKEDFNEFSTKGNAPIEQSAEPESALNYDEKSVVEGRKMADSAGNALVAKPEMLDSIEIAPSPTRERDANFAAASVPPAAQRSELKEMKAETTRFFSAADGGEKFKGGGGAEAAGRHGIAPGGCVVRPDDMMKKQVPTDSISAEQYGKLIDNEFTAPVDKDSKRSTFAIDVDTASYANVRRMINAGNHIPADAVRIEEMINYFDYQYAKPAADSEHPFLVHLDMADCPWNKENKLVRVALQGKDIIRTDRPASNVVFLLDVSGSMNTSDKLPLLQESLKYLLEEMNEKDSISVVVYAGASGLVLPATKVDASGRVNIMKALENLSAGGSTAGGEGIKLAYQIAQENFIKGGVNRVILATDGDFNVGVSDPNALSDLVKERAKNGVDISVLGFGTGNLNDNMLELITNNGNGNYSYIDTIKEGRKVLLEDMMGTLVTIAKDVKIQVEFNPEKVKEYRLIGYSNRMLPNEAFLDKKADAGEIGAGHRVTAFYEIVPGKALDKSELDDLRYAKNDKAAKQKGKLEVAPEHQDELLYVKLAYKQPTQKVNDESTYLSVALKDSKKSWDEVDQDFKFASSVALFGMVLRDSEHKGDGDIDLALKLAESGKGADGKGHREEFINLIKKMKESKMEHRNENQ